MLPTTRKEAKLLGVKHYNTSKPCKHGHLSARLTSTGQCCLCKNEYEASLRKQNPEKIKQKERRYYQRYSEDRKQYAKRRYEQIKQIPEKIEKRRKSNRNYNRIHWKTIYKKSFKYRVANSAARRAQKGKAAFVGYEQALVEIYNNCPVGYHVDHIVPLNHPLVCGLHVPWNLQYLTASDNIKKSNTFEN